MKPKRNRNSKHSGIRTSRSCTVSRVISFCNYQPGIPRMTISIIGKEARADGAPSALWKRPRQRTTRDTDLRRKAIVAVRVLSPQLSSFLPIA